MLKSFFGVLQQPSFANDPWGELSVVDTKKQRLVGAQLSVCVVTLLKSCVLFVCLCDIYHFQHTTDNIHRHTNIHHTFRSTSTPHQAINHNTTTFLFLLFFFLLHNLVVCKRVVRILATPFSISTMSIQLKLIIIADEEASWAEFLAKSF